MPDMTGNLYQNRGTYNKINRFLQPLVVRWDVLHVVQRVLAGPQRGAYLAGLHQVRGDYSRKLTVAFL